MKNQKILHKYKNALSASRNLQKFYEFYVSKEKNAVEYELIAFGTVKTFELAYETFWKYLKFYLEYQGILDVPSSPRAVFITALQRNIITKDEASLLGRSVDDRNKATHLYEQENAEEVLQDVPAYNKLFITILERLSINNE